jgi:hypothetical protein
MRKVVLLTVLILGANGGTDRRRLAQFRTNLTARDV